MKFLTDTDQPWINCHSPTQHQPKTIYVGVTSRQPRAIKIGIQAQLNLLIKVGSPEPNPTLPYFSYFPYPNLKVNLE